MDFRVQFDDIHGNLREGKPVLVSNFTFKNKNGMFVKENNTSGYIVAWAIYTLHIDKFFTTQQHAFQSFLSYFLV